MDACIILVFLFSLFKAVCENQVWMIRLDVRFSLSILFFCNPKLKEYFKIVIFES